MRKLVLFLLSVLFLGLTAGEVRAEGVSLLKDTAGQQTEISGGVVPDPSSRWFGVRWAFEKVAHNFRLALARTEEKKAELELRFATVEEKLANRIAELEETNPRAAKRLEKVADKLEKKRMERLQRLEKRIEKMGERGQKFEDNVLRVKERVRKRRKWRDKLDEDGENERKLNMETGKVGEEFGGGDGGLRKRIKRRLDRTAGDETVNIRKKMDGGDEVGDESGEDHGEVEMRGGRIRLRNAKPGVMRLR